MTTLSSILLYFYKLKGPKLTQAEGYILGVGANIFKIAGTVIACFN